MKKGGEGGCQRNRSVQRLGEGNVAFDSMKPRMEDESLSMDSPGVWRRARSSRSAERANRFEKAMAVVRDCPRHSRALGSERPKDAAELEESELFRRALCEYSSAGSEWQGGEPRGI